MKRTITGEMLKAHHPTFTTQSALGFPPLGSTNRVDDDERYERLMAALKGIEDLLIEVGAKLGLAEE